MITCNHPFNGRWVLVNAGRVVVYTRRAPVNASRVAVNTRRAAVSASETLVLRG